MTCAFALIATRREARRAKATSIATRRGELQNCFGFRGRNQFSRYVGARVDVELWHSRCWFGIAHDACDVCVLAAMTFFGFQTTGVDHDLFDRSVDILVHASEGVNQTARECTEIIICVFVRSVSFIV